MRADAAALLFYLLVAIVLTFPLAADLTGQVAGAAAHDGAEMARHVESLRVALRVGPLIYNAALLITLALNGLSAFALMRWLSRQAQEEGAGGEALLAGLIFMINPAIRGPLAAGDLGALMQWTFVLYAPALLRLRSPSASSAGIVLAAALFALSGFGDAHQIAYAVAPISAVVLIGWAWRRDWAALRRGIAALILGGLLFAGVLRLIGAPVEAPLAPGRIVQDSLSLVSPLLPPPSHAFSNLISDGAGVASSAYVGLIGGLLALIGIVRFRTTRLWLALGTLAFLLALGPLLKVSDHPLTFIVDGVTSAVSLPLAWIAALPGIDLAPTPERFAMPMGLALAILAGYGAAVIARVVGKQSTRRPYEWALLGALAVGIALDMGIFAPLPVTRLDAPPSVAALAARDDVRAVLDLPAGSLTTLKDALILRRAHGHPLVVDQAAPDSAAQGKLALLQTTLDPVLLDAAGADVVIIHRGDDPNGVLEARARAHLGEPLHTDAALTVFEVPPAAAPPVFTIVPPAVGTFTERVAISVYTPATTGALLTAALAADGRDVIVRIDDQPEPAARWTISGGAEASVFVGLEAGFHQITLTLDPPCVAALDPTLVCRPVTLERLTLEKG